MYFIGEQSQLWPDFGLPPHMPGLWKAKRHLIFTEKKPYPRPYVLKSDSNLISKNATQPDCISSDSLPVLSVYCIRNVEDQRMTNMKERELDNIVALTNMLAVRNSFCLTALKCIIQSARIRNSMLLVCCSTQESWTIMWSYRVTVCVVTKTTNGRKVCKHTNLIWLLVNYQMESHP